MSGRPVGPSAPSTTYSSPYASRPAPQPTPGAAVAARPEGPVPASSPDASGPAVDPKLVEYLVKFRNNLLPAIRQKSDKAEAILLSAATRALGFFDHCVVSDQEAAEGIAFKLVQQVLVNYRNDSKLAADATVIDPQLFKSLMVVKDTMVKSMKSRPDVAELMVMSGLSRVLGLTTVSIVQGLEEAEKIVMGGFKRTIEKWRSSPTA